MIAKSCIRRRRGHRLIDAAIRSDVLRLLNLVADNQEPPPPAQVGASPIAPKPSMTTC
jgi:hypothetical protein